MVPAIFVLSGALGSLVFAFDTQARPRSWMPEYHVDSTLCSPNSATHLNFNGGLKSEFDSKRGYLVSKVRP